MATKSAKPRTTPKSKKLTVKQKIIQEGAQQRQKVQEQVFAWQEHLFTQESVSAATLREAARWLQPQTYDEVVEERFVQSICGYPLCSCTPQEQESRYRISLSQRKVFDQSELASFCSLACLQKSKYYTMQLSEDPVWVRDLNGPVAPTIHVIPKEDNFKQSVAQHQRQQQQSDRSHQDLRREYVQKLLSNVPIGSNNNALNPTPTTPAVSKFEMTIVEKEPVESSSLDFSSIGAHDAIEGYRIENKNKSSNEPTTILLTKRNKETSLASTTHSADPIIMEKETGLIDSEDIDPESLLDNAMETMMMLKKMNLDRDPSPSQVDETDNISPHAELLTTLSADVRTTLDDSALPSTRSTHSIQSPPVDSPATPSTLPSASVEPPAPTLFKDVKNTKAAVAAIEAAASAAAEKKAKKAKKRKEPEMSLFGKVWTMLDRMTTQSTRLYLTSLDQGATTPVQPLKQDGLTDDNFLRGHIFSEKILESYGLIRSQLGIKAELEMDMVNLIKTFSFTDATMVVLDSNQTYMISLVLFKALATVVLKDQEGWQDNFELCCRYIGQTSDMVDACVRVLKVAST